MWDKFVEEFAADYHCVRVTLPSFGDDREAGRDISSLVEELRAQLPDTQFTLIGHDWGAYLSYWIEKKDERVERLVTLDVGGRLKPESAKHALFLVSYQWYLIAAYFAGKASPTIGNAMSRAFAKWGRAPQADQTRSRMNYLYFYFWKSVFQRKDLREYTPRVPTLFLYGTKKPYMFHSADWLELLARDPRSKVVPISAGHWFTRKPEAIAAVREWLTRP